MTSDRLSLSYLKKAKVRLEALHFYHQKNAYSDVVRESQECTELLLKALIRFIGVEVPKVHDVSRVLLQNKARLPKVIQANLDEIAAISRDLRKDRELSFYGTEDWIPTDEYDASHSLKAIEQAQKIYDWVSQSLGAV